MPNREQREQIGKKAREWGEEAEGLAAEYFMREGYMIRERRWRLGKAEIDLILEKDRTLIFVEVKARAGGGENPVEAVDRKKMSRMVNAADVYLRMQQFLYEYRFDIVTFTGTKENHTMEHLPDAFLPPVNGRWLR